MATIASGDVFKVASDGGRNSPLRLETQTAPPKHVRKWLFTASITFKRRQSGYGWSATIELDLNPIRFLAHRYMDLGVEGVSPVDLLKVNKRARENNRNATIADADNYLMGDALGLAQTVDWSVVIGEYLHAVTALVEAELGRADVEGQGIAPTWGGWTIRELESVWEFDEPDARSTFELIRQRVRQSFSAYTLHQYPTGASVHVPRLKGIAIAAYVKAETRLRFEVRHTEKIRQRYGKAANTTLLPNRHYSDIPAFIAFVHGKSAQRIGSAVGGMSSYQAATPSLPNARQLASLLGAINRCCYDKPATIGWILTPLIDVGRVANTPHKNVTVQCDRLVELGYLERVNTEARSRTRVYRPVETYRILLDAVRSSLSVGQQIGRHSP